MMGVDVAVCNAVDGCVREGHMAGRWALGRLAVSQHRIAICMHLWKYVPIHDELSRRKDMWVEIC
jgi:hypothetical protein